MSASCLTCSEIVRRAKVARISMLSNSTLDQLFHSDCTTCSAVSCDRQQLCSFCSHLRLRHVSLCYGKQLRIQFDAAEVRKNQETCSLCRVILNAAVTQSGPQVPTWIALKLQSRCETTDTQGQTVQYQPTHIDSSIRLSLFDYETVETSHLNPGSSPNIDRARLQPIVKNWSIIKGQVTHCLTRHIECGIQSQHLPLNFRVVDVIERRVVALPPKSTFVALSYVWGPNARHALHVTTASSINAYEAYGGLTLEYMPKTIEDSMTVCQNLGERYLWTDRLCIIQDDPADKAEQIKAMSAIYSSAFLVIIALDGDHMDSGLAGVGRSRANLDEHIEGLLVSPSPKNYLSAAWESPWYTRGWTYQEAVLSRRKLYFDTGQIFYECVERVWHEHELGFGADDFSKKPLQVSEDGEAAVLGSSNLTPRFTMGLYGGRSTRFGEYARHLTAYRRRSLTHQYDVYDAFAGILQSLYGEDEVLYGIPLGSLDHGLLWKYSGQNPANPPPVHESHPITPTWSWSSLVGNVAIREEAFQGTLVSWNVIVFDSVSRSNIPKPILPSEEPPSWTKMEHRQCNKITTPRVPYLLAWSEGCLEACLPPGLPVLDKQSFARSDEEMISRWPTYRALWNDAFNAGRPSTAPDLKLGTLCGRAQIASFRLRNLTHGNEFVKLIGIMDAKGDQVGVVHRFEPWFQSENAQRISGQEDKTFEFIALSVALHWDSDLAPPESTLCRC